jgi:hypothetical protein
MNRWCGRWHDFAHGRRMAAAVVESWGCGERGRV